MATTIMNLFHAASIPDLMLLASGLGCAIAVTILAVQQTRKRHDHHEHSTQQSVSQQ